LIFILSTGLSASKATTATTTMNAQQIKEFNTALRICRTLEQPAHADATDEDWDMYHLIYNNANDLLWKHAPSVMKGDNSKLKIAMEAWARDCDKVWNGTDFDEME
jgi:hypothetical protein